MSFISKAKDSIVRKLAIKYVSDWFKDGLVGKKGASAMKVLSKLQGFRTGIMALALLAEVIARTSGHEAGPLFSTLHMVFRAIGWNEADATSLFDPAVVGTALVTLYVTYQRFSAWLKTVKTAQ